MNGDITFEKLSAETVDIATKIVYDTVGPGIYTSDEMQDFISTPKHYFDMIKYNGEIIGVYYHCIVTGKELKIMRQKIAKHRWLETLPDDTIVCLLRTIGLVPEFRGKGITYYGLQRNIQQCKDADCKVIVGYAWEYGGFVPMEKIFLRNGFKREELIEKAWVGFEDLKCDKCGQDPCVCGAQIFTRWL